MATMITHDCINCGACEPECPNNAISQDENIYVIDPLLCTECVGFHDYEACAAVCPVDCCVTDPNNIEAEESLIARARVIHTGTEFGPTFESRFRKGDGKGGAPAVKKAAAPQAGESAAPASVRAAESAPRKAAVAEEAQDAGALLGPLPDIEDWEVPVRCFRCGESHTQRARHFMIGNVWFCPHCHRSMVVKDTLSFQIRTALKESYDYWEKQRSELQAKREKELREFLEERERELAEFKKKEQQEIQKLKEQLEGITESYQAPGRATKKRSLLGWG